MDQHGGGGEPPRKTPAGLPSATVEKHGLVGAAAASVLPSALKATPLTAPRAPAIIRPGAVRQTTSSRTVLAGPGEHLAIGAQGHGVHGSLFTNSSTEPLVGTSQSLAVLSWLPLAIDLPSGLKATDRIRSLCPAAPV